MCVLRRWNNTSSNILGLSAASARRSRLAAAGGRGKGNVYENNKARRCAVWLRWRVAAAPRRANVTQVYHVCNFLGPVPVPVPVVVAAVVVVVVAGPARGNETPISGRQGATRRQ